MTTYEIGDRVLVHAHGWVFPAVVTGGLFAGEYEVRFEDGGYHYRTAGGLQPDPSRARS